MGASAIEVGLELASVRREVTDLPPGPDTDASAASPQLSEQKAEAKETELPQDKPTEPEEADRVVTENESKKPKEDDLEDRGGADLGFHRVGCRRSHRDAEFEVIPEGPRSVAPVIGTGESARRARVTWQEGAGRASRQAQAAMPEGTAAKIRRDPDRLHARPPGSRARPISKKARAMRPSTRPRWRWCGVRISVPMPPPVIAADEGLTFTLPVIFRVKTKSRRRPLR